MIAKFFGGSINYSTTFLAIQGINILRMGSYSRGVTLWQWPIPLIAVIYCLALFAPDWDSLTFLCKGMQHEVVCEFTSKARVCSRQPSVAWQRENESERGKEGEGMSAKQGSNCSKVLVLLRALLYYRMSLYLTEVSNPFICSCFLLRRLRCILYTHQKWKGL